MARRGNRRATYRGTSSSRRLIQHRTVKQFARIAQPLAWWNQTSSISLPTTRNPLPTYRRTFNRRNTPVKDFARVKNLISHPLNTAFKQSKLYRDLVCAKRKIRKEVLHALHLTSRGAGTPHHRSGDSDIRC